MRGHSIAASLPSKSLAVAFLREHTAQPCPATAKSRAFESRIPRRKTQLRVPSPNVKTTWLIAQIIQNADAHKGTSRPWHKLLLTDSVLVLILTNANAIPQFESKSNRVKGIAFHPRLTLLAASLHSGSIQLWNFQMGVLVDRFEEHDGKWQQLKPVFKTYGGFIDSKPTPFPLLAPPPATSRAGYAE